MSKEFDWSTVEVIETTPVLHKADTAKPFAIMDLAETAKVAAVLTTAAQMFVWVWIVHQMKKRNSKSIAVSKGALAPYGISKRTKKEALTRLEQAGLILVERRPGKAPVVRPLKCQF